MKGLQPGHATKWTHCGEVHVLEVPDGGHTRVAVTWRRVIVSA